MAQCIWAQSSLPKLYLDNRIKFEHLSTKQGLSNNTVTAILQDKEGFLWVGTQDGLNRFDGYSFKHYPSSPSHSFYNPAASFITDIYEGQDGMLWITALDKSLNRLDITHGVVTTFTIDSSLHSTRNAYLSIHQDKQGIFWIPSPKGLNRFDPIKNTLKVYPYPFAGELMFSVCEDQAGMLWISTGTSLLRFDKQTGIFTPVALNPAPAGIYPFFIEALYLDSKGKLWVGANKVGLYSLDPVNLQFTFYPFGKNGLTGERILKKAMAEDNGMLWLGTDMGLQCLDTKAGKFINYLADLSLPGSLSSNQVHTVYKDRTGILWVGTNRGLDKSTLLAQKFQTYQFTPDHHYARLPENNIEPLYKDRSGIIWLCNFPGTGGLHRFDRKNNTLTRYAADPGKLNKLINNCITGDAVLEDESGILWVGAGDYLHAMDRQSNTFTRYPYGSFFWLIREDKFNKIWVGGNGIASFDKKAGKFTHYQHDAQDSTSLGLVWVSALLASRSGDIWVGGEGISKLDQATGKFTHYRPHYTHPAGHLNDQMIWSLYEDADTIMWIGTAHGGLNRFDPKAGIFTAFTTRDGLPSNQIRGITGDPSGNLWLTTNKGLCRFNPDTRVCRTYDQEDGLQDNDFHTGSVQYQQGELLVHGQNGFNVFYPDSIPDNLQIPPVYITAFKVWDKSRLIGSATTALTHRENFLSFDFVALNYIRPEKNQYAFQLVGLDKDWIYSGTRRFASYTNLDPGTYTFRVKASNNDGLWNEQGASLHFIIHPPFYRTWWFISLSAAMIVGLLYGGIRYRIAQIKKEESKKTESHKKEEEQKTEFNKKLSQMKMQAMQAQMNPHFIFNSLNSINCFILENETEAASDYLSKFSKLIRLILQNSNSTTIALQNELEALGLYLELEALRFDGKFKFTIQVDQQVNQDNLQIPPLIIQPYVENAIWHGVLHKQETGHIGIHVQLDKRVLVCIIEDDGIGRSKAAELKSKSATRRKSLGMQITSHRLELINWLYGKETQLQIEDLMDTAGKPCGTRVVLRIPV